MKLLERRREAAAAEVLLMQQRAIWSQQTSILRDRFAKHRGVIAIASGALAGMLCGILPLRSIARIGRLFTGVATFALRTPIAAMLVDAMKTQSSPAGSMPPQPSSPIRNDHA